jgi:putative membrane protein
MLLVFRMNTAYARWWEARTLWGGLVNASRNLAVKIVTLPKVSASQVAQARELLLHFPPLLKDHLRNEVDPQKVPPLASPAADLVHHPSELVQQLYALFQNWKLQGWIDGQDLRIIDRDAALLLDICGGCERIRNTPTVRSYRIFARQCVFLFLATFPWGIANDFDWWTAPMTAITAYFMIGLETVAEHVEEPFGYDEDDLDLDALCQTISRSVNQIFDRASLDAAAS